MAQRAMRGDLRQKRLRDHLFTTGRLVAKKQSTRNALMLNRNVTRIALVVNTIALVEKDESM